MHAFLSLPLCLPVFRTLPPYALFPLSSLSLSLFLFLSLCAKIEHVTALPSPLPLLSFSLQVQGSYDSELLQLQELFQSQIVHLLSDAVCTHIHVHVHYRHVTKLFFSVGLIFLTGFPCQKSFPEAQRYKAVCVLWSSAS